MRVVATAGHVDHGKSTLVFALTGTDPDRLAAEKERGLTIDLGFAFTTLSSGTTIGFVDVPGHVRFVKNMLAGVGAVDVAMLVVAANEGWMPQTAEHVAILDLLGVEHGVVALTKADLVDGDDVELTRMQLEEHLAPMALSGWPVVVVDGVSGRGLDDLRAALDTSIAAAPRVVDTGRPRLWVDRVFSARGSGTVVTGTLTGGAFDVDGDVVAEPGSRAARIRRIESNGVQLDRVEPGARVALNLAGVDHHDLQRGNAVVRPDQWVRPATFDVALRVITTPALPRRGPVDVHLGSGEYRGTLRIIGRAQSLARVALDVALPLAPGDRMILRSSARRETIGGAEVLDVAPTARITDAPRRLALPLGARALDARPWATPAQLAPLTGAADASMVADELCDSGLAVPIGGRLVTPDTLAAVRARATGAVASAAGSSGVDLAALASECGIDSARLRAVIAADPTLVVDRDVVRRADATAITDDPTARVLLDALAKQPFDPPNPAALGASPKLVRDLIRAGALVEADGVVFAQSAYDEARTRVSRAVVARGAITIADVRDLLGSSRKYVVPLLNRFDAEGVTRRRGDERIPGPRATP